MLVHSSALAVKTEAIIDRRWSSQKHKTHGRYCTAKCFAVGGKPATQSTSHLFTHRRTCRHFLSTTLRCQLYHVLKISNEWLEAKLHGFQVRSKTDREPA